MRNSQEAWMVGKLHSLPPPKVEVLRLYKVLHPVAPKSHHTQFASIVTYFILISLSSS
jgi:hypothetical protein